MILNWTKQQQQLCANSTPNSGDPPSVLPLTTISAPMDTVSSIYPPFLFFFKFPFALDISFYFSSFPQLQIPTHVKILVEQIYSQTNNNEIHSVLGFKVFKLPVHNIN